MASSFKVYLYRNFSIYRRTVIWKFWCMFNLTQSKQVIHCLRAMLLGGQLYRRFVKLCNTTRKVITIKSSCSCRWVCAQVFKIRIIIIPRCYWGYERQECNNSFFHPEAASRASNIKRALEQYFIKLLHGWNYWVLNIPMLHAIAVQMRIKIVVWSRYMSPIW